MLTLLLTSIFTLAFSIHPVKAEGGTIYIRADGRVDPPTAPIQRDGDIYTLTDNILSEADGIVIEKDHILIDGATYILQGTDIGKGIDISSRTNVTIKNVWITRFDIGIYLHYSSNITITENNLYENCMINRAGSARASIALNGLCYGNIIYGNNITNNEYDSGIWLYWQSSNNIIYGNNVDDAGPCGIYLSYLSSNNVIYANNISNTSTGIGFYNASGNKVYHNNFVNNLFQASANFSVNTWDDGYPSGGNYWSDYQMRYPNATEIDGSGIWNTPYVIDASNQDHYPLMNQWKPTPYVRGVDVSEFQCGPPLINWTKVHDFGVEFAYVRATLGDNRPPALIDKNFTINMVGAKEAGLLVGAYHVAYADRNNAVDEAEFFLSVAGNYIKAGYLRPMLDLEQDILNNIMAEKGPEAGKLYLQSWVQEWASKIENETGYVPILYMGKYAAMNYFNESFRKYDLWIVDWTYDLNMPPSSTGIWEKWVLWQYSNNSHVDGITGFVDCDVFNGDINLLRDTVLIRAGCDNVVPIYQESIVFSGSVGTIAFAPNGTLYFNEGNSFRVFKVVNGTAQFTLDASPESFGGAWAIAFDPNGTLYFSVNVGSKGGIYKVVNGKVSYDTLVYERSNFYDWIREFAFDENGTLYFSDGSEPNHIYKVTNGTESVVYTYPYVCGFTLASDGSMFLSTEFRYGQDGGWYAQGDYAILKIDENKEQLMYLRLKNGCGIRTLAVDALGTIYFSVFGCDIYKLILEDQIPIANPETFLNTVVSTITQSSVVPITSNSTISDFAYNSSAATLSFKVEGNLGTTGKSVVWIPKEMVSSSSNIEVTLDDYAVDFEILKSQTIYYVILAYNHSQHVVTITLLRTSTWLMKGDYLEYSFKIEFLNGTLAAEGTWRWEVLSVSGNIALVNETVYYIVLVGPETGKKYNQTGCNEIDVNWRANEVFWIEPDLKMGEHVRDNIVNGSETLQTVCGIRESWLLSPVQGETKMWYDQEIGILLRCVSPYADTVWIIEIKDTNIIARTTGRYVFQVSHGEADFNITMATNSTVQNFEFNQTAKEIAFDVKGLSGTVGYCNITIPDDLLWGTFSVYMDGSMLKEGMDYVREYNGTHYTFHITYNHSSHTIEIRGTEVIPEFPSALILSLFMLFAMFALVLRKKTSKKTKNINSNPIFS
jgi:lysozyme